MKEVYLLLGSNEGGRKANLESALEKIELCCGKVLRCSSLYETEAWGLKEQPGFLNQAVLVLTGLKPFPLLSTLKTIERESGRTETVKWGPRVIDIDILFYAGETVNLPELKIPHPYLHERRFTLAPLNEIAAGFVHPVLRKSVGQLLDACTDEGAVRVVKG
ncbi:MAG: 2-amino-4-hydroxy-6-hydroxymethyldihydropteridine diphosphokinase [Bacteroidota bacterium]